jgi:hypothetical protein
MPDDLFSDDPTSTPPVEPTIDEGKTYLDELVGEGKKFSDVEALAKGKASSDQMIEHMKKENAQIREELQKRLTLEEFMSELEKRQKPTESTIPSPVEPEIEPKVNDGLSEEKVAALLEDRLSKLTEEQRKEQNLQVAISKMNSEWGSNAKAKLQEVADKLSIPKKDLQEYAKTNPTVFLQLVGLGESTPVQSSSQTVPTSQVDTSKMPPSSSGEKTYQYYEKMRKENPREYHSAKVQNEMMKQATKYAEQGIDFTQT